ncbi:MAG TPA: S8 family serine peptidase [Mycobacteriales bacterium]|nr:S8 family serine peptidase [Mycobacteriales bacterium]
MRKGRGSVARLTRSGALVAALALVAVAAVGANTGRASALPTAVGEYVVLYADGASAATARGAVRAAGGTVVAENATVGYALVHSRDARFVARASHAPGLDGVARNAVVGLAPKAQPGRRPERRDAVERPHARWDPASLSAAAAPEADRGAPRGEPLAARQWDMRQIGATPTGSYAVERGRRGVVVGVIDTGIDATHPDLAPNLDRARSRNFTTDIPLADGPCEVSSCRDPVGVDPFGHGSHVASTIAAPINGFGIAGVAPNVTLVDLRAGQDSGLFFLKPTLDALSYAAEIGVDVVNMSYYVDPWLYNCPDNRADTPAEQQEQRAVRRATQRAITYAVRHGVLPVVAAGNENEDLGRPTVDATSPDYPPGRAKTRRVDNECIRVPAETEGVVVVSSTGPSTRKAYYSNYGTEQTDVAAPGGDVYDAPGSRLAAQSGVLGAYPTALARAEHALKPDGTPTTPFVLRDCHGGTCAYYRYMQGTSMAAPHASGVAALIVARYGSRGRVPVGLAAERTRDVLLATATPHACPTPRRVIYAQVQPDGSALRSTASCVGRRGDNGFYGRGIVDAARAVRR